MTVKSSNLPLIPEVQDDRNNSEEEAESPNILTRFTINKYFVLFDIVPPILWIIASCVSSLSNTIIHFLLTILYSFTTNTPRKQDRRKSFLPYIIFIFSLIYSLAYLIGQLVIYLLTKSGKIESLPTVVSYFDIYSYEEISSKFAFINVSICIVIIDIIYLILYSVLVVSWYRRAKSAVLRKFSRLIIITFLICFSLAVSFSPHRFCIFVPIMFGICCILVGLFSRPLHYILVSIFSTLILLSIIFFLVLISSDIFAKISMTNIPRWARILTVCISGYLASIFCGNSFKGHAIIVRLVMPYNPPSFISRFAPFVVIISSLFFSIFQASWVSVAGLLFAIIQSFFPNKTMSKIVPITFIVNVVSVVIQLIISIFNPNYTYISDLTLIIPFTLIAISALFLSNSHGEYFSTKEDDKSKMINNVQNIFGTVLMISYYVCSALFVALYPCLITSLILVVSLAFALLRLFNITAWCVIMAFTSISTISQALIYLMINFTDFAKIDQKLYNYLFIPMDINNDPLYLSLWPVILLFFLSLLIKSICLPPHPKLIAVFKQICLPILVFLPIIFMENSVFSVIYLILFILTLHIEKVLIYLIYITFAFLNLIFVMLYQFDFIRDLSFINSDVERVLGLSTERNILGFIFVSLLIFLTSYTFKFDMNLIDLFDHKIYLLFKSIFSLFTYYFVLTAVFLGVLVDHKSSFVHMVILLIMGIARIFTSKGRIVGFILYILFIICNFFQLIVYLVNFSNKYVGYIGPSISSRLERFINIITIIFTLFFYIMKNEKYQYHKYLLLLANFLRRNILVVVQISLGVSALTLDEVLAPISALLLLFLSFKRSIGKVLASFLNILMLFVIIYIMYFMLIPYGKINNVTKYLMLNTVENIDVVHAFLHLLTCSLLLDFGINLMPGFGRTIITAYAYPIIAPITLIFSCMIYDYISSIHTLLLIILTCLYIYRPKNYGAFMITIFVYTICTIFVSTVSHMPWVSNIEKITKFILFDKYPATRICIFIFEFLLVTMIRSDEYNEVQDREIERKNFRTQRQEIFSEIKEKDELFIRKYFQVQLHKLQSDFETFSVEGSYVPHPITENEIRLINGYPIVDKSKKLNLLKIFQMIVYDLLDMIIRNLMIIIDYNLEPGMSLPGVTKLNQFYDVIIAQYEQTQSLEVPNEWKDFADTIPYSLRQHFRLISRLKLHQDRKIRRFQLLHRYIVMILRNIVTYMVNIMGLFYPFVQHSSIFAFIWIILVLFTVSLKITTYKHYFTYSIIIMAIRLICNLPYISDLIIEYSNSVSEQKRNIPILTIFGLNDLNSVFAYDACLMLFSALAVSFRDKHPLTPSKEKGFKKITQSSPYRVSLTIYIFIIDFINFLVILLAYGGWTTYGTNIMTMISGSSTVSPFFVSLLLVYFSFMLGVYVCYLSHNPIAYFISTFLFALFTFIVSLFVIPSISKNQSWEHPSFKFFLVCRLISQFLMSCQLYIGFPHEPPQIGRKKALFSFIAETVLVSCPFLFEFKVVMRWIATKTSIKLWDSLVLELVKSKVKASRARSLLIPPQKQKSRISGIFFLFLMIFLLFFPLFILSSSGTTTVLNPASMIQSQFGISGVTAFYQNMLTVENSIISEEQQKEIASMNDTSLLTYYSMSTQQIQVIDLPFGSMEEFLITPDATRLALDQLKKNNSEFTPFGSISLMFKHATTKNAQQIVNFNFLGDELDQEQKENLSLLLSEENLSAELRMPHFLPMFIYVPYESSNSYLDNYFYDVIFTRQFVDNVDSWNLKTIPSDPTKVPPFLYLAHLENVTRLVLWSQPTPDKLIGSLLTSTGGIIGLYAFIVLTIGQFLTMWVASKFTDLWIRRLHNPFKLLNALLAIEAYRLEGDLDKEFTLSQLVLENLRSTTRIIQITDIANSNIQMTENNNIDNINQNENETENDNQNVDPENQENPPA